MSFNNDELINFNIRAHDEIAAVYDERHAEIFNPTEQQRLNRTIKEAYRMRRTSTTPENTVILDFGSGTGNLTRHLLELGAASVMAADVSPKSLAVLKEKFGSRQDLSILVLNGSDLKEMASDSIDMIVTYSVLHHVPDYLRIVEEFVRVVKPGGIIYIDHEVDETYWEYNADYMEYLKELGDKFYNDHAAELGLKRKAGLRQRLRAFLKKLQSRPDPEKSLLVGDGDIHVYRHDHIEWNRIRALLEKTCIVEISNTYLVCRETADPPPAWKKWHERCFDMRLLIARKK
ncbi:class I SAM-dependent methyltransferase [Methylosarcina fibrata]|uniref:class I SAM-dependent methyltransferase n=1 Tax=Methylosarcina fibrata TaxID=105972 RepID=UPI00035D9C7D|nr:class I SAM-dependent methyltransferase [Methylosarcina fibrata]